MLLDVKFISTLHDLYLHALAKLAIVKRIELLSVSVRVRHHFDAIFASTR